MEDLRQRLDRTSKSIQAAQRERSICEGYMLTIPKAAKECGLPYPTLLRLVNEGIVPSIKIDGRRSKLMDIADVQAYLEAHKSGGETGSFTGSLNEENIQKPAQIKRSQRAQEKPKKMRKSALDAVFERRRASCS